MTTHPSAWLMLAIAILASAASIALALDLRRRNKIKLATPPKPTERPEFARVGGRTVAMNDWSPEVLEEIRKQYFRPSIKDKHVAVVDITATCPRSHATRDRVVLVTRDASISKELSTGLIRSRADVPCDECRKPARLSARSVVWEGPSEDWDGSA